MEDHADEIKRGLAELRVQAQKTVELIDLAIWCSKQGDTFYPELIGTREQLRLQLERAERLLRLAAS